MSVTFFISDLHLQAETVQTTDLFLQFLASRAREAEALYILGDLFEVWVGDDDLSAYHLKIIEALRQATDSGLPIYLMRGNRDFLIGKKFARKTGIQLLNDPTVIDLYGVRTLLMLGDSLCTLDIQHQKTRRFTLNPICQWLALRLPLSWRRRAGVWLRTKSRRHHQHTDNRIMDVNPVTVTEMMRTHQVSQLIHGHTHRPAIHSLPLGKRIVLGAWHQSGSVLQCDAQKNCVLEALGSVYNSLGWSRNR